MKKERFVNMAGILVFYFILILGVVAVNVRMNHINNGNMTTIFCNR